MCGIGFWVTRNGKSGHVAPGNLAVESDHTYTEAEINEAVAGERAAATALSAADQRKIANMDSLRDLQSRLSRAKNARDAAKVAAVEHEITLFNLAGISNEPTKPPSHAHCIARILARGPDYARHTCYRLPGLSIECFSSVLSLRQPFKPQPVAADGFVLHFNGEIYNEECLQGNDTEFVLREICSASRAHGRQHAVSLAVQRLVGEFAYVVWDQETHTVYFGKDRIGKRSLLFAENSDRVCVASLMPDSNAVECVGGVLYQFSLNTLRVESQRIMGASYTPINNADLIDSEKALESLHIRLKRATNCRQFAVHPLHPVDGANVAILFSGGLDCTVLAALIADSYAEQSNSAIIDLLTVGFENPRTQMAAADSPDRLLSRTSWLELCGLYESKNVQFRLVQIDVGYSEWLAHKQRVLDLISPCSTEMDLSIAIAFYFASCADSCVALRRVGEEIFTMPNYTSTAKVLFSGLGADELFGGYSRHENLFYCLQESSSKTDVDERYDDLSQSFIHDIEIIYERNLGRDDRAISSWGKELRYPYLDEEFVRFVIEEVDPRLKIKFTWTVQTTKKGEKRVMQFERKHLLRRLARTLGLCNAAGEAKRAIQFGAKSAKMEIGQSKTKGTDQL